MFKKTFEKFFGSQTPAEVLSVPSAARNSLKPHRSKELKRLESDIVALGALVGISVSKENPNEKDSKSSKKKNSDEKKTNNNNPSDNNGAAKTKFWGKGTGYGHSSSQYKWDVNSYQNASSDAPVAKICETIQRHISEALRTTDAQSVTRSLQNSCLMPFLSHHCRNDSLVDMERHRNLYEAVFNLLAALCDAPCTARLFLFSYHTSSGASKGDMSDATHYHKSLYGTVKKLKKHAEFVESKQEALVARLKAAESAAADATLPNSQPQLANTDSKPAPSKAPAKKTGVVKVKDSEDGASFTALLLKTAKQVEESVSRLQSVACQPITSPRKNCPLIATKAGEEKMEVLELPQMVVDDKPTDTSAAPAPSTTSSDPSSAVTIVNIPPLTMPSSPVHSSGDVAPASPSGFSIGGVDGPLSPTQSTQVTASPASTPAPGSVSPATIAVSASTVAPSPVTTPAIPTAPAVPAFAATGGDDDDILGNFFDESPSGTYTSLSKPKPAGAAVETKSESDSLFTEAEKAQWEEEKKVRVKISYEKNLEDLRFQEIADFPIHHYKGQSSGEVTRMFVRRVASEFIDLSSSLPINPESSVFMRVHESNTTMAQFMVTAPTGTPYGGGCFLFDVMLPSTYPNQPPKVNLQTTGKASVRFNPNLYNCGKVCLSLLGTWGGQSGETWIAGTSTLLQVMVSIQSLIFVPHPYFNEPGYERQMGTPNGDKQSDNYNKNIEQQTVRWAMIDMLRNPPAGFEDVVRRHFYLRQDAILEQVQDWLKQPGRTGLQSLAKELKEELKKLGNPLVSTQ